VVMFDGYAGPGWEWPKAEIGTMSVHGDESRFFSSSRRNWQ